MLTLLKLIQQLLKTLHSEGTPHQVALGIAIGSALGLTPLLNVHNLLILAALMLFNVSFAGGMLGFAVFAPLGFLLDPLFDRVGRALLSAPALQGLWTNWYNTPLLPYTNFNNSVVLGSVVVWFILLGPIYLLARVAVARYRATWGERVRQSKFYQAVTASKAYNAYRLFQPE